jgi:division protein CdvB (Snf7/Vps24/ESCRT-III family)
LESKKFNAAEKHFQKKEVEFRKEKNIYKDQAERLIKENAELQKQIADLARWNKELQGSIQLLDEKYQKVLEYSKLSNEDVILALKRDKDHDMLSSLFGAASKTFMKGF